MTEQPPEHFVFLLMPEFTHLAFSCAIEPLRIANLISGQKLYEWSFMSDNGETATASNGVVTQVHRGFEPLARGERHVFLDDEIPAIVSGNGVQT